MHHETRLPAFPVRRAAIDQIEGALLAVSIRALPVLASCRLDHGARLRPARYRVLGSPLETCPCRRSLGRPWPGRGQRGCRAADLMPWDRPDRQQET